MGGGWRRRGGDLSGAFRLCAAGVQGYGGDRSPTLDEEVWGVTFVQPDYGSDLPSGVAFDAPE